MPPVPHDPAHHARMSYQWRDEHWHLLDDPLVVVLISNEVSRGTPHRNVEEAERAFWSEIVDSMLATPDGRLAYATWPGVEIVCVSDKAAGQAHVAERARRGGCRVWRVDKLELGVPAWQTRVRCLLEGEAAA
jgi:hypothetical protein